MRRNDLTTEEVRFERLLRSLDRGPVAPDADFLRQLRETATAAFVAAQPTRPRPVRAAEPPVHPAAGRQRLRSLRVALLTSVVAMLCLGVFSNVLFPARGVELRVALNNLNRASSGVIEFQNGTVSNTLLFVRDEATFRRRTQFASGNAELFDGGANYFLNRDNNSFHPALPEEADLNATAVEVKLLVNLNVNDPQFQLSLLNQRPQSQSEENGKRLYYYNYSGPVEPNDGTTLTINATVNATDNTLVTMNSQVFDAAGKSRFRATADVKSLNTAIPEDRFQLDPQAAPQQQIALVEDVQGEAFVDDLTELPNPMNNIDHAIEVAPRTWAMDRAHGNSVNRSKFPGGFGGGMQAPGTAGDRPAPAPVGNAPQGKVNEELTAGGLESMTGRGQKAAVNPTRVESVEFQQEPADKSIPSRSGMRIGSRNSGLPSGGAATPVVAPQAPPAPVASLHPETRLPAPRETQAKSLPKGAPDPRNVKLEAAVPPSQKRDAVTAESEELAQRMRNAEGIQQQTQARRLGGLPAKAGSAGSGTVPSPYPTERYSKEYKESAEFDVRQSPAAPNGPAGQLATGGKKQELQSAFDRPLQLNANSSPLPLGNGIRGANSGDQTGGTGGGMGGGMGGYSLGLVRRQVAPQSELLPGGVLSTDENPANVVRARLANGADLYVGPSSEVKLLKPTEVRLQSGELVLIVPAGDQVDLLGPETGVQAEPENNRLYNRRGQGQLKAYESRRQVTGRATYRIENRLLQQMEQEPAWLTTYNTRLNSSKANPPSLVKQPVPSSKEAPGFQKARATEPTPNPSPK